MAANSDNPMLPPLAERALRILTPRGQRPRGLVGLALGIALALAAPSTAAISRGTDAAPAAAATTSAPSSDASADAASQRRSGATPRPMTSGDRQAIFMVMMLRGPNASSQILGLTH